MVIMAKWDATECLRLIEAERVTTAQMVPANFIRILEADWEAFDRSSVRKVLHAAAPCPVPVKRKHHRRVPGPGTVWEYYGASEGMASVISPEEWLAKPGSVGRPFPGLSVRILDEDGADAAPRRGGGHLHLVLRRPALRATTTTPTRPTRPGATTTSPWATWAGWTRTAISSWPTGAPTSSSRGGVNIYPAEVETALVEDADVVDAAVFGLPDERMGQQVHAVVELRPGADRDAEALLARLAGRLADYKRPRQRGVRRRAATRSRTAK